VDEGLLLSVDCFGLLFPELSEVAAEVGDLLPAASFDRFSVVLGAE
jgi:hypothetical protein